MVSNLQLPTMAHLTSFWSDDLQSAILDDCIILRICAVDGEFRFAVLGQMLVPRQKCDVGKALVQKDDTQKSM